MHYVRQTQATFNPCLLSFAADHSIFDGNPFNVRGSRPYLPCQIKKFVTTLRRQPQLWQPPASGSAWTIKDLLTQTTEVLFSQLVAGNFRWLNLSGTRNTPAFPPISIN
jgi:hypothetical protein